MAFLPPPALASTFPFAVETPPVLPAAPPPPPPPLDEEPIWCLIHFRFVVTLDLK